MMFWHSYWKKRARATEQALIEAQRDHMRDMTALVDAAGGVIRVEAGTMLHLPRMTLTISPTGPDAVEYRRHFGSTST